MEIIVINEFFSHDFGRFLAIRSTIVLELPPIESKFFHFRQRGDGKSKFERGQPLDDRGCSLLAERHWPRDYPKYNNRYDHNDVQASIDCVIKYDMGKLEAQPTEPVSLT